MRPVYPSRRPQRQGHRRGGGGQGARGNVLDSNGPAGRVRGTPAQLQEKYRSLASDAQTHGDRVQAEAFLQYAEHYRRLLNDGGRGQTRDKAGNGEHRPPERERGERGAQRGERRDNWREQRGAPRAEERADARADESEDEAVEDEEAQEAQEAQEEQLGTEDERDDGDLGGEGPTPARRRASPVRAGANKPAPRRGSTRGTPHSSTRRAPRPRSSAGADSDAELKKMLGGDGNGVSKTRRRPTQTDDDEE